METGATAVYVNARDDYAKQNLNRSWRTTTACWSLRGTLLSCKPSRQAATPPPTRLCVQKPNLSWSEAASNLNDRTERQWSTSPCYTSWQSYV